MIGQSTQASEAYIAFLNAQKEITYTLGDFTGTPEGDMKQYTELKIAAEQEKVANDLVNANYQEALKQAQLKYEADIAQIRTDFGA